MATEAEANRARTLHAETLRAKGAHALSVEAGERYAKTGFVVVAHVDAGVKLPSSLKLESEGKPVGKSARKSGTTVPLITIPAERFKVGL